MIDFTKPVQTKYGQPVEIISTSGRGHYPVKGYRGKECTLRAWALDGSYGIGNVPSHDLENVPEYWAKEKEAFEAGKTIQYRSKYQPNWNDMAKVRSRVLVLFLFWFNPDEDFNPEYRIKPDLVPLTKDDIKAGDIFLAPCQMEYQWTARNAAGISVGNFWISYQELKEQGWEIKSLNDTAWRPCEKEAE